MSRINHDNIDKWLFDLTEGKLNATQKRELNSFLQTHPEYQLDLDSWAQANLREENDEIVPLPYEAELLAIAEPVAWKRYAAVASVLLLMGAGSFSLFYFSTDRTQDMSGTTSFIQRSAFDALNTSSNSASRSIEHSAIIVGSEAQRSTGTNPTAAITENDRAIQTTGFNTRANQITVQNRNTNATIRRTNYTEHQLMIPQPVEENPLLVERVPETTTQQSGGSLNSNTATTPGSAFASSLENNGQSSTASSNIEVQNNGKENELAVLPSLVHVFDQHRPEIRSEEQGAAMAKTAIEIEKANAISPTITPKEDLAVSEHKEHTFNHKKRKKFGESGIGLYNSRDHRLLHPDNINTSQYAAFAGSSVSPALSLNYRNQWSDAEQGSQSGQVVFTQYSRKLKTGWGFGFASINTGNGAHVSNAGSLYFSPKIRISKSFTIEPGMTATFYQNATGSQAMNSGMIEPVRGLFGYPLAGANVQAKQGLDIAFSTLFNTKYFFFAGGVDNILHPALNIYNGEIPVATNTPMRVKFVAGTDYKRFHESKFSVSPQISFNKQGLLTEIWAGSMLRYDWITMGAAASQNGQLLGTIGIQTGNFRMSYNFDVTKSYMNNLYYGSHEVSLRLGLGGLSRKPSAILNSEK